jgi:hypothetical protein
MNFLIDNSSSVPAGLVSDTMPVSGTQPFITNPIGLDTPPPAAGAPLLSTSVPSVTKETTRNPVVPAVAPIATPVPDGIFFVGSTGEVETDFLVDAGLYHSEVALFSLTGMDNLLPGSKEFIDLALTRALSDSVQGHIVIKDSIEGAKLSSLLGEINFNDGPYLGSKKFSFTPGDRIGILMTPNGTIADALKSTAIGRALFSIATANPSQAVQFGQLRSNVFGWEDVAGSGDRDYNDLVLSIQNISGKAIDITTLIAPNIKWQEMPEAKSLFIAEDKPPAIPNLSTVIPAPTEPSPEVVIPIEPAPKITSIDSGITIIPPEVLPAEPRLPDLNPPTTVPPTNPTGPIFKNVDDFTKAKYGISVGYLPSATLPAAPDGTWSRTIANFDVAGFVEDVVQTGAGYVIFAVGQTSGYYNSPNTTYLSVTNTQPGQYLPTRDLVLEVAQGLKKKGIATLVYIAAEGPTAAPAEIINNFPIRSDRASDPDFRKRFNQVIQEWSERWGTDVAGWWIDGAWVDGYTNPIDGETNLNELLTAARAGNPASLIALNPSSGIFTALTPKQDFLAGEDTYFSQLPSPTKTAFGTQHAWHTISFLGSTWNEPSASRYSNQQLIDYVQAANQNGGIVTMDVGIDVNGHLSSLQVAQVAAVKTAVRGVV